MGRLYFEHLGGEIIFHCGRCKTYLTNKMECLSDEFQGATGPAYLFDRVVNVSFSGAETRCMITGKHIVRDVHCKNCRCKLGWIYEFAYEPSQAYKEGHVILEKKLLHVVEEENPKLAESLQPHLRCISNSNTSLESSLNSSDETMT